MFDYFDHFLPKTITFDDAHPWHETNKGYEFEAYAFAVTPQEGYVVVEQASSGRFTDMRDIIKEEFDADTEGWLVLLAHQNAVGKSIILHPTHSDMQYVTYADKYKSVWIIKIKPHEGSILLR